MFKLEKLSDKAVLTIYGYVGGAFMDFRRVAEAMDDIKVSGYKKLQFRMHTYGGDVFDGNLMYNFLAGFDGELEIYIDGVAASMGSSLMLAGDKKPQIARNGFIMIHAPSGGAWGNAKDMLSAAKLLRSIEKNFITDITEATGKTEAQAKKWMDGTDYWFSAEEALKEGLVSDIFDPKAHKVNIDKNEAIEIGAQATYERFAACLKTNNEQTKSEDMNKEDLIKRYALTSVTKDSTDEEVLAAVDAKMAESNSESEKIIEEAITASVDAAIEAKKIAKAKRDEYIARGKKLGLKDLNAMFADMSVYEPVTAKIKGGGTPTATGRENWTWDDYQEKAPKDLEAMADTDPETFKALYKAEFKTDPPKSK